jgi:hypothetical protein
LKYFDGSPLNLGDVVSVEVSGGTYRARIVMLGDTYEHLAIDHGFLTWVNSDRLLREGSVVVEWLDTNPFAHNESSIAPVGNYMFATVDEDLRRDA